MRHEMRDLGRRDAATYAVLKINRRSHPLNEHLSWYWRFEALQS